MQHMKITDLLSYTRNNKDIMIFFYVALVTYSFRSFYFKSLHFGSSSPVVNFKTLLCNMEVNQRIGLLIGLNPQLLVQNYSKHFT